MDYSIFDCVDSGTENCPCYLAQTGDCLMCSRLQGKDYCDCRWKGVCIYNEFVQGGKKVNNPRKDFKAEIVEKRRYLGDLTVFIVAVDKGFALKASRPGSYVFLKAEGDPDFYNVPISVMKSDVEKGQLHLAVKAISTKTKLLFAEEKNVLVRGVYRNGILNIGAIIDERSRMRKGQSVLIITKGVGFSPAVLFAEWVADKAKLDFLIDIDKMGNELVLDYIPDEINGTVKQIDLRTEGESLERIIRDNQYDAVLTLTSDFYIEKIRKILETLSEPPKFAYSNNFRICCGEGICGACSIVNSGGVSFKMCKCNEFHPECSE